MKPLRVGLAGLGRWGRKYVDTLASLPGDLLPQGPGGSADTVGVAGELTDVQLTALCDTAPAALARAARSAPNASLMTRFDDLLGSNVDAIIIATPTSMHADLAVRALAAGKHVLIEKPLGHSVESAETVVRAASRTDRVVAVGHLMVRHPALEFWCDRSLELVGRVRSIETTRISEGAAHSDEGALSALVSHDAATILGPLGLLPQRLRAHSLDSTGARQAVVVELEFADGVDGRIVASRLGAASWTVESRGPTRELRVNGSAGVCVIDELSGSVSRIADDGMKSIHDSQPCDLLQLQCANFVRRIRSDDASVSEARLGLAVVRLIAAASKSIDLGGTWVDVSIDSGINGDLASGVLVPIASHPH